jgi:cyclophilin family peptidyl-prolyl cis-trans isomerase
MSTKHLFHFIFATIVSATLISCSPPEPADRFADIPKAGKFSDSVMREIHNLKNDRNTSGLILFLLDENPAYRAEAAFALGSVQDSTAVDALSAALEDEVPEVRMMASFALGQLRIASVADVLIGLIESDTTTEVRTEALEALGKTGSDLASVFLLDYEPRYFFDEGGKAWGIYQLGLHRKATVEHAGQMAALLASEYEETRLAAAHFFSRFVIKLQSKGLERLLNMAATDASAEVRMAAAKAVGHYSLPDRDKVLSALVTYDADAGVRTNAIRAMQQAKIASAYEVVFLALDDGNPNVALAASDFIAEFAQQKDAQLLTQKALVHANQQVQSAIYSAALKVSNRQAEVSGEIKRLIAATGNQYHRASLIRALKHDPRNVVFLDSIVFSGNPVTATAALETIHAQLQLFGGTNEFKVKLMHRLLGQNDAGLLSYAGVILRDEKLGYKGVITDFKQINVLIQALKIPEELEAWVELNSARSYLSETELQSKPELSYHLIDWELIQTLGSEPTVKVHTDKGVFELLLLPEDAPATVSYFYSLVKKGYYNGKSLHRVVPNFVIQTGCPRGDGYGSTAPLLRSEFSPLHYGAGVAGIASVGKDTESCQWFVTHCTTPHLDGRYSIFAAVISGMEVVQQLELGNVIDSVAFEPQ